ncbi:uncharacterized protein METZ01_LOCUS415561, partial [marine metagenome]
VAPFFIDKDETINLNKAVISLAVGQLVGGFVYIIGMTVVPGINQITLLVGVSLALISAYNCFVFRYQLIPTYPKGIGRMSIVSFLIKSLLFVLFVSPTFIASIIMGADTYPPMFFNSDTPSKLSQAHSLMIGDMYPPQLVLAQGIQIPYHYGGPSAVAALSSFTGIPVHKSMFWVVSPLL